MEGSGTGISRLDCYEDMFKEITKKLYGEDLDHRTSSVQNEFETSVSYKNDDDTGNGTDGSDDGHWVCEDEPLKGTDGSRIAAYHPGKTTWRCYECGDVMGGGPREVAEHFMEHHSSRIIVDDARGRHHSPRKDYLHTEVKIEDVAGYLDRVRDRAERGAPPARRTQETQTVPAALLPMTSTFLLQELPTTSTAQHLHQNSTMSTSASSSASTKRYTCPFCPYGTDRRDLYTRHENIHREEKPFHCYVCYKPFNRADHVKKHFLRMHREHAYELSRIRRPAGTSESKPLHPGGTGTAGQQPQHPSYVYNGGKTYQLQPSTNGPGPAGIYQNAAMPNPPGVMQPDASNCPANGRRVPNGGCNSKSHLKSGSKSNQERRYTCCYCSWSGVDNWCLKRHLNTHLKPFACSLCEYKAARAERLATHVLKVHNRRQCSRCDYLGEDAAQLQMHQLHVHRVGSASAPAASTAQTTSPPSNRHQPPLHPAGGGRPPPGPPVFPAPAPAIAPATTVIPPSTILGHEMVNFPATAATMAYPTEEEEAQERRRLGRRLTGEPDDALGDLDSPRRAHGNRREVDNEFYRLPCTKDDGNYDRFETCCGVKSMDSDYRSDRVGETLLTSQRDATDRADSPNQNFTCSCQFACEPSEAWSPLGSLPRYEADCPCNLESERDHRRRSRKQSQPRKVTCVEEPMDEEDAPDGSYVPTIQTEPTDASSSSSSWEHAHATDKKVSRTGRFKRIRERRRADDGRTLRCHQCPRNAPARGKVHRPYHTKASLALHKLWWHDRRREKSIVAAPNKPQASKVPRASRVSTLSSITLKATVFTSPGYAYHR